MEKRRLSSIVLAAGKGTRMKSQIPKVLHPVAGRPMILHIIEQLKKSQMGEIRLVVGHGAETLEAAVKSEGVICFKQLQQKGTADAVKSAQPENLEGDVLIVNGDHPLMTSEDIQGFVEAFRHEGADLAVVTVELDQPGAFGRVVRRGSQVKAIVEAKDASPETLQITEINTGIYIVKAEVLSSLIDRIENKNAQEEFYLTDLVELANVEGKNVVAIKGHRRVARGVNSQLDLVKATRSLYKRKALELLEAGVTIVDPLNTYIESTVSVGSSTVIQPGVHLRGKTQIGEMCVIEPNVYISKSEVGDGSHIRAGSYLEEAHLEKLTTVGPYARLRPSTILREGAHVGNFVEMKKVDFGKGSKAGHLTYLGDAEVGEGVNIGCGTITCNYAPDRKKYKTVIGKGVFVGSDTQFVAPVKVEEGAIIASGSTITKDVPSKALAVARGRQKNIEDYVNRLQDKKGK